MNLSDTEAKIQKSLGNIAKLGKAELADKAKAAAIKEVVETMKKAKDFQKAHDDLNKRIKEAKSLQTDIDKYRKDYSAWIKEATTLATKVNKLTPDTKGRDYFMIANYLSMVGQMMLDDYP